MERLKFDVSPLDEYRDTFWEPGTSKLVEFYENEPVLVHLYDIDDPDLLPRLEEFADETPMSIDMEWKPDRKDKYNPIGLFQFGSTNGVFLVTNAADRAAPSLSAFLQRHKFFGKGMTYDYLKLKTMFGETFDMEDIQESRIIPNELPVNFVELVNVLLGDPMAKFKDKTVSCSDWSRRPLTVQQALYAAFDAYATFRIYQEIRRRFGGPEIIHTEVVLKRKKRMPGQHQPKQKGKGRQKPQMIKQFKPKFVPTVEFHNVDDFKYFHRLPYETSFTERKDYNPKRSVLEYLKAYKEIEEHNDGTGVCHLCRAENIDALEHAWNFHADVLVQTYFPDQSPSYFALCLQNIKWAHMNSVVNIEELPKVACAVCGRAFPSFHAYFTHSHLVHGRTYDPDMEVDPKELLLEHFQLMHMVENTFCHLCQLECGDRLLDHCWSEHGVHLAQMLKHRPINYHEGTFAASFGDGVLCINQLAYGEVFHGSICCAFCKIGFDDPGELFVHLFHRHTKLVAVHAADLDKWPLKAKNLGEEYIAVLHRMCCSRALACLHGAGIFVPQDAGFSCSDCSYFMIDEDVQWQHALSHHLIVTFDYEFTRH